MHYETQPANVGTGERGQKFESLFILSGRQEQIIEYWHSTRIRHRTTLVMEDLQGLSNDALKTGLSAD
jgi:hypothetical protein